MEREPESSNLVELGTASFDTLGTQIVGDPEQSAFYVHGLTDE